MHHRLLQVHGRSLISAGLLILAAAQGAARADEPGFLGRLFRLGGSAPSGSDASPSSSATNPASSLPYGANSGSNPSYVPRTSVGSFSSSSPSAFDSLPQPPAVTAPMAAAAGPGQRLAPQPRVSSAVTTADPVLTRFALGRSSDGSQFGMFLQVFADGTVVDSEGVHRLRPGDLRPIVDAVQSGELYRLKGHCGAPATDFIEYVHIVVYEHRLGRLMAHSFSYSGNPQGCDHAIRHIHTALENLQAKLSRQAGAPGSPAVSGSPTPLGNSPPAPSSPLGNSPAPVLGSRPIPPATTPAAVPSGPVIPLTPLDSPR
jgi:hypothetical protein